MTTVNLNDTLVNLESLHAAYEQILIEARQQLEKVDLTDATVSRVSLELAGSSGFQKACVGEVLTSLRNDMRSTDTEAFQTFTGKAFVQLVAKEIYKIMTNELADDVNRMVDARVNSSTIDNALAAKITDCDSLNNAIIVRNRLADLLKVLPETDK